MGMVEIFDSLWFNQLDGSTVGIVAIDNGHEIKAYIAPIAIPSTPQFDSVLVVSWGARMPLECVTPISMAVQGRLDRYRATSEQPEAESGMSTPDIRDPLRHPDDPLRGLYVLRDPATGQGGAVRELIEAWDAYTAAEAASAKLFEGEVAPSMDALGAAYVEHNRTHAAVAAARARFALVDESSRLDAASNTQPAAPDTPAAPGHTESNHE